MRISERCDVFKDFNKAIGRQLKINDSTSLEIAGILKNFISTDSAGNINLEKTVSVSGLGGRPDSYRDGSFEYYMSEPVIQNDAKGIGAFIKCAAEIEWYQKMRNEE